MLGLVLLLLALWLAFEICAADFRQPAPPDPYRLDRWRGDKGPDERP